MKAVSQKTNPATTQHRNGPQQPFFQKGGQSLFGNHRTSTIQAKPFFSSSSTIQTKLTIGQPNDPYEREADQVADHVVQRLAQADPVQAKPQPPISSLSAPASLQPKCANCEQEEKLQKKETDQDDQPERQTKPIFDSALPPPDEDQLQRQCAHCEQEEKVQRQAEGSRGGAPTASSSVESQLSASRGGGSSLPADTRQRMESAMGADFSGVRVHTGGGAVQMSRELNAQAFTHGRDIYFNSGKYDPGSVGGQRLLAHELTHTVQQGASSDIQRLPSWDDIKQGAGDAYDSATEGLKEAGEAVVDTAQAVADMPGQVVDWIASEAGEAALALANLLINRYGGEIRRTADGGIEIILPSVTLLNRHAKVFPWSDSTKEKIILQKLVEVPYVGPVFLTLFGRGQVGASIAAGIGPTQLKNISLTINPGKDFYGGTATLSAPVDLSGNLTLTGILGGLANPSCVQEVLRIEGGLSVSGTAGLQTELVDTVNVTFSDGEFDFVNKLLLNNCLIFNFDLNALASVSLFQQTILAGQWNLLQYPYEKCWPIILMGDVFTGGGGSSGGGGASDSWDGEGDNGGAAFGGGGATGDYGDSGSGAAPLQIGNSLIQGGVNTPTFTADSLIDSLFDNTQPSLVPKLPIGIEPDEKKILEKECPIAPKDPCKNAPTGLTPDDPIPMIWLKNPFSPLYDTPITLVYFGEEFRYSLFTPEVLPDGSEKIGIEPPFMPFPGKPLTKRLFRRGFDPEINRFRSVLRRFGYDFTRRGRGVDADHFQDDLWEGPSVFGNFWPLDFRANASAGSRQNVFQEVTWAEFPGGPVFVSCIADKDLRTRYFVIQSVQNPEADIKTRACNRRERIC